MPDIGTFYVDVMLSNNEIVRWYGYEIVEAVMTSSSYYTNVKFVNFGFMPGLSLKDCKC